MFLCLVSKVFIYVESPYVLCVLCTSLVSCSRLRFSFHNSQSHSTLIHTGSAYDRRGDAHARLPNHVASQPRVPTAMEADTNASKIAKFGLSLDGQAANWYSQHDLAKFPNFDQWKDKFLRLFHHQIPQRELMSQFYAICQDAHGTVPQFVIRFQSLRHQLTWLTLVDELNETFLSALREPLRTTLVVVDFTRKTPKEVIDHVLRLDSAQTNDNMNMTALQPYWMTNCVFVKQSNTQHVVTPIIRLSNAP